MEWYALHAVLWSCVRLSVAPSVHWVTVCQVTCVTCVSVWGCCRATQKTGRPCDWRKSFIHSLTPKEEVLNPSSEFSISSYSWGKEQHFFPPVKIFKVYAHALIFISHVSVSAEKAWDVKQAWWRLVHARFCTNKYTLDSRTHTPGKCHVDSSSNPLLKHLISISCTIHKRGWTHAYAHRHFIFSQIYCMNIVIV